MSISSVLSLLSSSCMCEQSQPSPLALHTQQLHKTTQQLIGAKPNLARARWEIWHCLVLNLPIYNLSVSLIFLEDFLYLFSLSLFLRLRKTVIFAVVCSQKNCNHVLKVRSWPWLPFLFHLCTSSCEIFEHQNTPKKKKRFSGQHEQ